MGKYEKNFELLPEPLKRGKCGQHNDRHITELGGNQYKVAMESNTQSGSVTNLVTKLVVTCLSVCTSQCTSQLVSPCT